MTGAALVSHPMVSNVSASSLAAIKGMNMNRQGKSCSSTSRVFVHQALHGEVAGEIVRLAEALPVGFPWIESNELGVEENFDELLSYTQLKNIHMRW